MSSSDWHDDHDEWMSQFNTMVNEALGVDEDEPWRDDADEMSMSDIAAKLMNGKIDLSEAIKRVHEWLAGRMGWKLHRDPESWEMEMAVGGLIEITDELKINLLSAGEVGLADAIIRVHADPRMIINGGDAGDVAQIDNAPCIGAITKSWCTLARLNPTETANLHWAVSQALKTKLSE